MELYGEGFMAMLISAIIYLVSVLIRKSDIRPPTQFNLILENISVFMAFGIASIAFGIIFYSPAISLSLILFVYFFAITTVLSMARNWENEARDSLGWPIAFNGVFLPLFYYMYIFYFQSPGSSIFLFYFAIAGLLSVSSYKFLLFDEKRQHNDSDEMQDKLFERRIKSREKKRGGYLEIEGGKVKRDRNYGKKEQVEMEPVNEGEEFDDEYDDDLDDMETGDVRKENVEEQSVDESEKKVEQKEETKVDEIPIRKNKKGLFSNMIDNVKFFTNRIILRKDDFNRIEGMPDEKELEETLGGEKIEVENIGEEKPVEEATGMNDVGQENIGEEKPAEEQQLVEGKVGEESKTEEQVQLDKKAGLFSTIVNKVGDFTNKVIPKKDDFNKIEGMPDEKELAETLGGDEIEVENVEGEKLVEEQPAKGENVGEQIPVEESKPKGQSTELEQESPIEETTKEEKKEGQSVEGETEEIKIDDQLQPVDEKKKELESVSFGGEEYVLDDFEDDFTK